MFPLELDFIPFVSISVLTVWLLTIILHFGTSWLPKSPFGFHYISGRLPAFQVASAPLFIYNSDTPIWSSLVQAFSSFISPLGYGKTTGEVTKVTFGFLNLIDSIHALLVLGLLEFLFRRLRRKDTKSAFKFACTLVLFAVLIFGIRTALGFASFHVGRSLAPSLCYSEALREVSRGLLPTLIVSYFFLESRLTADANWPLSSQLRGQTIMLSDVIFLLLCLPFGFTFWWDTTAIVLGTVIAFFSWKKSEYISTSTIIPDSNYEQVGNDPKSRISLLKRAGVLLILTSFYYWLTQPSGLRNSSQLSSIGYLDSPLVTFVVMTAPRKNGVDHLQHTIQSYLDAFPTGPQDPLYTRIRMIVFTHFTENPIFDRAAESFSQQSKAQHYIEWVRFPGSEFNQKKHFDAAIRHVAETLYPETHYIGIIEDDFPLCEGKWDEVLRIIRDANREVPEHCGVFIGTGGSGLLIRTSIYEQALRSMHGPYPTDTGIHYCLKGYTCAGCQVVVPSKILMYHTGNDTSTMGHAYNSDVHQCGARHPFIGDLDAIVL